MKTISIDDTNDLPIDTPIFMLNLLRFHSRAQYTDTTEPCTGQEAYLTRYVPAFQNAVSSVPNAEATPIYIGRWHKNLVSDAEAENWDMMAIVKYPSVHVFRSIVESAVYVETAEPHRLAALEGWKLVVSTAFP